MSDQKIPDPWNLIVTRHAIERYRERTSGDKLTDAAVANTIRNMVIHGQEMVMRNEAEHVKQMLAHDCKPARYFKNGAFLAVVEDRAIVTVHTMQVLKWKPKPNQ